MNRLATIALAAVAVLCPILAARTLSAPAAPEPVRPAAVDDRNAAEELEARASALREAVFPADPDAARDLERLASHALGLGLEVGSLSADAALGRLTITATGRAREVLEWAGATEERCEAGGLTLAAFTLVAHPGGSATATVEAGYPVPGRPVIVASSSRSTLARVASRWPRLDAARLASFVTAPPAAEEPAGVRGQSAADPAQPAQRSTPQPRSGSAETPPVYVGSIRAGSLDGFVFRFEAEDVVRVMSPGTTAFGWTLLASGAGSITLEKEGFVHAMERP